MENMYNRYSSRRYREYYNMLDPENLFEVGFSDGSIGNESDHVKIESEFTRRGFSQNEKSLFVASYCGGYLVGKKDFMNTNQEESKTITGATDAKRRVLEYGIRRQI